VDFSAMINHQVTISGVAYNALGSAVVADPDVEWLVYVDGLEGWDESDYGKKVEVTGLLVREAIAPQAVVEDGRHSHGAKGKGPDHPRRHMAFPGLVSYDSDFTLGAVAAVQLTIWFRFQ
jgi:hypothetical protein